MRLMSFVVMFYKVTIINYTNLLTITNTCSRRLIYNRCGLRKIHSNGIFRNICNEVFAHRRAVSNGYIIAIFGFAEIVHYRYTRFRRDSTQTSLLFFVVYYKHAGS